MLKSRLINILFAGVGLFTESWNQPVFTKQKFKKSKNTTNWKAILKGQTNGRRECERRMRQMGVNYGR